MLRRIIKRIPLPKPDLFINSLDEPEEIKKPEKLKKVILVSEDEINGAGNKIIDKIEIPKYVVPLRENKIYPRLPFFVDRTIIVGGSGSGKSIAILNIILSVENISHVYLFIKTVEFDEDEAIRAELKKRKIEYEIVDIHNFREVQERIEKTAPDAKKSKLPKNYANYRILPLLIFDDIGNDLFQNIEFENFLKHSRKVCNGVIISLQSHQQITPSIYSNMTRFILFTSIPERDLNFIINKMISGIDKEIIKSEFNKSRKEYNFIVIDFNNLIITEKFSKILYKK